MELKSNKIKSMNDFIIGIALMALGAWLIFSKNITEGRILKSQNQGILQADTYLKLIGGLIFFLAFLIVIRSFNFKKGAETKAFEFHISKESLLTFVALILFIVLLKPLGFAITTFLVTYFIVCLYMLREIKDKGLGRREKIKKFVFAGVFSAVLVVVVYLIFSKVLLVILP
jgi:hypothetical protein